METASRYPENKLRLKALYRPLKLIHSMLTQKHSNKHSSFLFEQLHHVQADKAHSYGIRHIPQPMPNHKV
jgi:hypothetical protein